MKSKYECTEEKFLSNVKDHSIEIIKYDGVHRHIKFSNNGSSVYRIDLITWPGCLCIRSDCGTYVFSRTHDMFEFFRTDERDFNHNKHGLSINPGYWGEKLLSIDRHRGYEEFDAEIFRKRVKDHFESYIEPELEEVDAVDAWQAINEKVLTEADNGEHYAYDAINNFNYNGISFIDFFDSGGTESYTYNYIWCLYAIDWGIKKYDELIAKTNRRAWR